MVQRIGRQFPELEVGGSNPPGSAARISPVLTLWTAGDGRYPGESKLAGYPLFMEWLRVRVPPVIDVDTKVHLSRVTARTRLREIESWRPSGGGTDLSLPFTHAVQRKLEVDGFALFTDGETWAGRQHPSQALAAYRRRYNPGARVVLASMTAAGHSIAEPRDAGVLNIAGMDAALPTVVTGFIR
jgi:hypothetical protein